MLRYGIITEIAPTKGLARVTFSEDKMVSALIPCLVQKSKTIKASFPFEINEQVVCLMDSTSRNGVILGAIYTNSDMPSIVDEHEFGIDYGGGKEEKMNSQTGLKTIKATKFKINSDVDSLYAILNDTLIQIQALTVMGNLGFPTGPPINLAAFTSIQTRINAFLTQ